MEKVKFGTLGLFTRCKWLAQAVALGEFYLMSETQETDLGLLASNQDTTKSKAIRAITCNQGDY